MNHSHESSKERSPLFQIYLRLRPTYNHNTDSFPFLMVEPPCGDSEYRVTDSDHIWPIHITVQPPDDSRKRAVERFAFTKVFEENANQLDLFKETGMMSLIEGVLNEKRDALVATLGVTGSGKSHTIFGSKSERGITQMALDALFRSLSPLICSSDNFLNPVFLSTLSSSDPSEAQLSSARSFLESIYYDPYNERGPISRAQTPMTDSGLTSVTPKRNLIHRPSTVLKSPSIDNLLIPDVEDASYVILLSMYEVYNDRIYDLLAPAPNGLTTRQNAHNQKDKRRPLLFKSTEASPDRKVVAGLRKIICGTYEEALMVLETGLTERRVAGTGSNNVSSRSHGFFCIEVRKKSEDLRSCQETWIGNTLTIVDLAGSERARNAKTAGATLAEAGKINESLMYLGQCLQMQGDFQDGNKILVPFRQCKLTELLFSNSFPSSNTNSSSKHPQKAIMIVTADKQGDFNATSQILRYSALAREVTVPRIPSITSNFSSSHQYESKSHKSQRQGVFAASAEELETAALEIAKISDEYDALTLKLSEQEYARTEAEFRWKAAEEHCLSIEQEVREECWAEMEARMEEEKRRWQQAWEEQSVRHDEHLDRKLDLFSKGVRIYQDPQLSNEEQLDEAMKENDILRNKIANLERELHCRSPTKTRPKSNISRNVMSVTDNGGDGSYVENTTRGINQLGLPHRVDSGVPMKVSDKTLLKKKALARTSRQRDLAPETEVDF